MRNLLFLLAAAAVIATGCGNDETVRPLGSRILVPDSGGDDDQSDDDSTADDDVPIGGTGNVPDVPVELGKTCLSDGDCADGLECITPDADNFLSGGPAHGYCTTTCDSSLDCAGYDAAGECLGVAEDLMVCLQGCLSGAGTAATKCHGRQDVSCTTLSSGISVCQPACQSDEDCGDERFCHYGSGTCVAAPPEGNPIGSECDPDAEHNGCASGICLTFQSGHSICSGICRLGGVGCGGDEAVPAEEPGSPYCAHITMSGLGFGDTGRCGQRCNCGGECSHEGAVCWTGPFGDGEFEDGMEIYATLGICVGAEDVSEEARVSDSCGGEDGGVTDAGGDGGMSDQKDASSVVEDASSGPSSGDSGPESPEAGAVDASTADDAG